LRSSVVGAGCEGSVELSSPPVLPFSDPVLPFSDPVLPFSDPVLPFSDPVLPFSDPVLILAELEPLRVRAGG
jgi:hypothetical protein